MPHLTIADAASRTAQMDKPKRWNPKGVKKSEDQDDSGKRKAPAREEREERAKDARKRVYDHPRS